MRVYRKRRFAHLCVARTEQNFIVAACGTRFRFVNVTAALRERPNCAACFSPDVRRKQTHGPRGPRSSTALSKRDPAIAERWAPLQLARTFSG